MRKKIYIAYFLALSVIIYVIILGLITACNKNISSDNSSNNSSSSPPIQEVTSYWTCSMHPQIHQDKPGKCPICGMDLIKVSTKSTSVETDSRNTYPSGHGAITLSPAQQEMIGVKFGEVIKKNAFKVIDTAGRVAFDPELFTAQNEYLEALKQEELIRHSPISEIKRSAHQMVESSKMRLKILGLSNQQIASIKDTSKISTGILIPKKGEQLWVYAEVYEIDLPYIKPQMKANIRGHFLEGKTLVGEVISVDRVINPTTRTAKVRIALPATILEVRPESYVEVSILSPLGKQLIVPFDAILDTGKESWVFVSIGRTGRIEPRKVIVNNYLGDEVTIASGLSEGEKIVTSANFLVDSESRLVGVREEVSGNSSDADTSERKKNKITCPEGKNWNEQMGHCM
ncbi:MAG: efflux RND transporter periplasmic adaptor subunit [Oligoflexia bacterium]|nr:efflux RND transporter periplasmic adaptor subunit [Oligoflexia bacterium]